MTSFFVLQEKKTHIRNGIYHQYITLSNIPQYTSHFVSFCISVFYKLPCNILTATACLILMLKSSSHELASLYLLHNLTEDLVMFYICMSHI